MKSKAIICLVSDLPKAKAVQITVDGPIFPVIPTSVMQQDISIWPFLENDSALLIS